MWRTCAQIDIARSRLLISYVLLFLTAMSLFLYVPVLAPLLHAQDTQAIMPPSSSITLRQRVLVVALTLPMVCSAFGALLCGVISDIYGRKRSLLIVLTGATVASVMCAAAIALHQWILLMAALALLGFMDGSAIIVQAGVLEQTSPEQQAAVLGKLTAWATLGVVIGPFAGGVCSDRRVFEYATYYMPFLVMVGLFGLAIILVGLFYGDSSVSRSSTPVGGRGYFSELLRVVRPAGVRRFAVLFFLMELVLACFYERVPLLLQQHQAPPSVMGLYGAYVGSLIAFACGFVIPFLQRCRFGEIPVAVSFALLVVAGALLFGQASLLRIWLCGVPLGFGVATIYCLTMARLTEATAPQDQGKIAGIATWASCVAFLLAGALIGGGIGFAEDLPSAIHVALAIVGLLAAISNQRRLVRSAPPAAYQKANVAPLQQ